jgi:hypothetical protein
LVGKSEGKSPLEDIGVYGKIIIKWKWSGKVWIGCIWLRIGCCEQCNEIWGSIKGGKLLDELSDY